MIRALLGIFLKLLAFIAILISGSIVICAAAFFFMVWCLKKLLGISGGNVCRCNHCSDIIDM